MKQAGGFIRVCSDLEAQKARHSRSYLHRAEEAIEVEEATGRPAGTWQGAETILLVEDQPELRKMVRMILESYGYRVLEAGNADEALHWSERWTDRIHLMLTDVVMPGMNGWDLANRFKTQRPQINVIYMSGY